MSRGFSSEFLRKFLRHWRRLRRARAWGIPFRRVRNFTLPPSVRIGGREVPVSLPDEAPVVTALVALLLDDEYGLEDFRGPVRTVLDIGGNIGLFTLAAGRAFPGAVIHAYEPNRAIEPRLRVQAAGVGATVFTEAVGLSEGRVSFVDRGDSMVGSVVSDPGGGVEQVSIRTALDRLGARADLAKIDCEGAEWDILEDASALARIDRLALEYHPRAGRDVEELRAILRKSGFRIRSEIATAGGCGVIRAER